MNVRAINKVTEVSGIHPMGTDRGPIPTPVPVPQFSLGQNFTSGLGQGLISILRNNWIA